MPISSPLVSVIALCYNQEDFLVETLDSIKAQTFKNLEFIIVDDCSSDQSVKKIESWIKANKVNCKFIKNKENLGLVKSLNIAVKQLKGKYYSLIACDDIYLPKKIENQVKILEVLDDSYGAIYSDSYIIDENSMYNYGTQIARKLIEKPPSGNIYEDLLKNDNFVPALSVIYKTEVVKDLGYYDESLIYEDYDMLLRLSKKFKVAFSKSIDACYRLHQTNMNYNLNKPKFLDSKIKILFKHLNKENSNLEIGTLLKEKISNLCEQLYMQKSNLTHGHLKKLREDHNYGKIIYFCNYIGFSWKVYFIMRIILLNRKHILTLNIR
jgi:glycosyltransferase involved in cell wall biosynthesis